MIGSSLDSQHGDLLGILRMLAALISGTPPTTKVQPKEKTTKIYFSYFRSNPKQRWHRKRMIKI